MRAGISSDAIQAEVAAGRWSRLRDQVIELTDGASLEDHAWRAILATAPRSDPDRPQAAAAGVTALQLAGLRGVEGDGLRHLAAPKSSRPVPTIPGWRIHETRRWRDDDVVLGAAPRIRPAVALLQAAFWARTDREAALMVVAPLQQRLTPAADVLSALERVRRDRRRRLVGELVREFVDGIHSLNELDLARLCRDAGLPEPDRQVVLRRPGGAYYLDARWTRWRLVAEVDGVQHLALDHWVSDLRRHNEIALSGSVVLRISSVGLRLEPHRELTTIERALRRAGWH